MGRKEVKIKEKGRDRDRDRVALCRQRGQSVSVGRREECVVVSPWCHVGTWFGGDWTI